MSSDEEIEKFDFLKKAAFKNLQFLMPQTLCV
jgi:hypothetical protein